MEMYKIQCISNDSGATRAAHSTTQTMDMYRIQCILSDSGTTPVRVRPSNPKRYALDMTGYAQHVFLDPSSFSNLDYGNHRHCLLRNQWKHMETHGNKNPPAPLYRGTKAARLGSVRLCLFSFKRAQKPPDLHHQILNGGFGVSPKIVSFSSLFSRLKA